MSKTSYILTYFRKPVAVINAESQADLKQKTTRAIQEHLSVENDSQFELSIGRIGDWGEETQVTAKYVDEGSYVTDDEFTLIKTVSY
jgi:hypothetical protein